MKDGVIADYRVTQAMLKYFMKKALGKWNPFQADRARIRSCRRDLDRKARRHRSGVKAGAKDAYVVKEPILAAIGAGIPIQEPMGRMVATSAAAPSTSP
jgi:rod shape-determining protein MreB